MKFTFALIVSMSFSLEVFAQNIDINTPINIPSRKLYFAYGQTYKVKLDRTFSRLAKEGFNNFYFVGIERQFNEKILNIQSVLLIGTLKTRGNRFNPLNNYAGAIKMRIMRQSKKLSKSDFSVHTGINLIGRGDVWFPQLEDLRYAWDIYLGAGWSTSIRFRISSELFIQNDFDISLLGILWRSHNNGQQLSTEEIQLENGIIAAALETPNFSHPLNTQYIDNSLKLYYVVSGKFYMYYNFNLSYSYLKLPLVKKGYELTNSIGLTYRF
ncbi:MAG: hypothetical protein ISP72_02970 [Flavobacteriaceae bacterium]|nr:hypothetical protein [Flavobacteriaceae bacterium]